MLKRVDRQKDRQTGGQSDRQTDRKTDRQTELAQSTRLLILSKNTYKNDLEQKRFIKQIYLFKKLISTKLNFDENDS